MLKLPLLHKHKPSIATEQNVPKYPKHAKYNKTHFKKCIDELERENLIDPAQIDGILTNLELEKDFERAAGEADFIVEAVVEDLEIKQEIFAGLAKSCKTRAVLTSTTSTLFPSQIAAKMKDRRRMLVAHFWNPAYLVPLVEVCAHDETTQEAVDVTMFRPRKRKKMPALPPKKRIRGFKEVELGFETIDALTEADRCLQCGMFPKK